MTESKCKRMGKISCKKGLQAFTLAEVLITLGIIGIVAAMTLPTLIQNHQKRVILTQLKKNYAILLNWVQQAETREELPMNRWPTGANMNVDDYWNVYIQPYFAQVKKCSDMIECGYNSSFSTIAEKQQWSNQKWTLKTGDSRVLFQLGDGTVIFLPRNTSDEEGDPSYTTKFYVDVNGTRSPNTYCKDVFPFVRGTDKGIEPYDCTKTIVENNYEFPADYQY